MRGSLCKPNRPIHTGSSTNFMALTMIDLDRFQHFELVELPTIYILITNGKERTIEEKSSIKSSDRIARLVDKIWLCIYPRCRYLIYDTGSEFKLHFETQRKPTTIKNPKANAILWARPSARGCAPLKQTWPIQCYLLTSIHLSTTQHGHLAKHTTKY